MSLHGVPDTRPPDVRDVATDVTERDWVLDELGRIHIDQRAVMVLHHYVDLPLADVAATLGIPYGTAASRLHRGLAALRASMRVPSEADGTIEPERAR